MRRYVIAMLAACWLLPASHAAGEERFALIVAGATGGAEYGAQYTAWIDAFSRSLEGRLKFTPANVTVLSETEARDTAATAENVRRAIASIRQRMTKNDLLFVLLIGHGTFDGEQAKFNLVGRDLESAEWAALLQPLPGRVVIVNSTAGSFPFIERLSGPRRIVITATDSPAQTYDTVFPEFFVKAFEEEGADIDRNQRISVWEAFAFASAGVRRHYQQRGLLPTERSLLDDNGDAAGKGAAEQGADGAHASRTYLDQELPGAAPTDDELLKLLQKKALVEAELEELKIRKAFLAASDYAKEFERIIIDLSRVSSEIRRRGKT